MIGRLLLLILLLLPSVSPAAELSGVVRWVYDGDTLQVQNIGKVRLLGIDSPESQDSDRDHYYFKHYSFTRQQLRRTARLAKQFNIEQSNGKRVLLKFDQEKTDKYGRLLAYLYLPDGRMLNRMLLEEGLACVFRRYPFRHKKEFLEIEKRARQQQRGIWQQ